MNHATVALCIFAFFFFGAQSVHAVTPQPQRIEYGTSSLDDRRYPAVPDGDSLRYEHDLVTGRLSRVPVSKTYKRTITLTGSHRLQLRAKCLGPSDDIAIIVTLKDQKGRSLPFTAVNDAKQNKGSKEWWCGWLDLRKRSSRVSYTISVVSMNRATARLKFLQYKNKKNKDSRWKTFGGSKNQQVGGTLLKVGALWPNDFIEIQRRVQGQSYHNIEMLLFRATQGFGGKSYSSLPTGGLLPPTYQKGCTGKNWYCSGHAKKGAIGTISTSVTVNPRIAIKSTGWVDSNNYLLLSKRGGNAETFVDIFRGPRWETTIKKYRKVTRGGSTVRTWEATLLAGRYLFSIQAFQKKPVGHYTGSTNTHHLAGNMPALSNNGCPSVKRGDKWSGKNSWGTESTDEHWYRGQHNEVAFKMWLERRNKGGKWSAVTQKRPVLRGAIGTDPSTKLATAFVLAAKVRGSGKYRLRVHTRHKDVTFKTIVKVTRNPDIAEIKVATANVLYDPHSSTENELRNYANLLGARGTVLNTRVLEPKTKGPFQWDTDVFVFQEGNKITSANFPDEGYLEFVKEENQERGTSNWEYVRARDETWDWGGRGNGPGMGPIYVRDWVWPGVGDGKSIVFSSDAAKNGPNNGGGCKTQSVNIKNGYYFECHSKEGNDAGEDTNYMSAATIKVYRGGGGDIPVALFNVHLEASDGAADFTTRHGEVTDVINTIKDMIQAQPKAFNPMGERKTKARGNRFIVLGDWNTRTHECGEHYWLLRRFREEFGYAVDAAMAMPDLNGKGSLGMHAWDDGYDGTDKDYPKNFQYPFWTNADLPDSWESEDPPDHTVSSKYPWWAATGRTKTHGMRGGERYDMIFLVGLGWRTDDPLLEYKVMVDRNKNKFNSASLMDNTGRAVNMFGHRPACSPNSVYRKGQEGYAAGKSYAPNHALGSCGTKPGAPALETDHRPVGVRLRVWGG